MARFSPTPEEYNYYVNWVLYAILGRLAEADNLMQEFGGPIRNMAKKLVKLLGVPRRAIYRGMVLDPGQPGADLMLAADPQFTFVSWSEDKDVACWFADRDSVISGFVRKQRPGISGWVAESWTDEKKVLFHWSWAARFPLPGGQRGPLWLFARHHPDMIPAQVEWAMTTQREVILRQDGKPLKVAPYAASGCPPTADLDTRLTFRENPPADWRDHAYRRRPSNLEMEDAEDRVLAAGAAPPLDYMGSGAQGIVFCGAEGHAWKAARGASDPRWAESRRASLRDEHDWLLAAGRHPETARMVPRVYALHEAEAVLERDCPRGKLPEWNARWDDWHGPLGSVPGWGTPEGGRDQWIVTPGGPVIIDGGYAHRRGEVLAQHVVDVLSGDKPRYGERLTDMAWSVYVDTQQGRLPLDRGISVLRLIRRRGDDSEFSSEAGIARLPRVNPRGGLGKFKPVRGHDNVFVRPSSISEFLADMASRRSPGGTIPFDTPTEKPRKRTKKPRKRAITKQKLLAVLEKHSFALKASGKELGIPSGAVAKRMEQLGIGFPEHADVPPEVFERARLRRAAEADAGAMRTVGRLAEQRSRIRAGVELSPGDPRKDWHGNPDAPDRGLERMAAGGDVGAAMKLIRNLARSRHPEKIFDLMLLLPHEEQKWAANQYWAARGIHDPHWWYAIPPSWGGGEGYAVFAVTQEEAREKLAERGAPDPASVMWMDPKQLEHFKPENVIRGNPPSALARVRKAVGRDRECYPAAEVVYHAGGGKRAGLTPVQQHHQGRSHWWVRGPDGKVLDPAAAQFSRAVPYKRGKGKGFLTKKPSKRARALARRAGVKLNPDERVRRDERLAAAGDAEASARVIMHKVRSGELLMAHVRLAANLTGRKDARLADPPPHDYHPNQYLESDRRDLVRWAMALSDKLPDATGSRGADGWSLLSADLHRWLQGGKKPTRDVCNRESGPFALYSVACKMVWARSDRTLHELVKQAVGLYRTRVWQRLNDEIGGHHGNERLSPAWGLKTREGLPVAWVSTERGVPTTGYNLLEVRNASQRQATDLLGRMLLREA